MVESTASKKIAPGAATEKTPTGRQHSLSNLQPPWPKGTSGNPSGRPRRKRGVWINVNSVDSLLAALLALMKEED